MNLLLNKIKQEYQHFLKLGQSARQLLLSYGFFELVEPMLFSFINAFVFRQTNSFVSVMVYNIGQFIFLPLFFYINGLLLKRFSIKWLYTAGLIGQGVGLLVVFFVPITSLWQVFCFGCGLGAAMGLFWSNRNFLNLKVTTPTTRTYFVGLESLATMLAGLTVPILIGAVISFGSHSQWYAPTLAYQLLGVLSFAALLYSGKLLAGIAIKNPKITQVLVTKPTKQWWFGRLAEVSYGTYHGGFMYLPTLLVFSLLGREGTLGALQSFATACSAVILYYFSRKLAHHHRLQLVMSVMAVFSLSAFGLSVAYVGPMAILLLVIAAPINNLRWLAWNTTIMDTIEAQKHNDEDASYAYVVDREIFLNIGRIIGVLLFLVMSWLFTEQLAVRWLPMVIAGFQLVFVFAMSNVLALQPKVRATRNKKAV